MRRRNFKHRRLHFVIDLHSIFVSFCKRVADRRINHVGRRTRDCVQLLVGVQVRHRRKQCPSIRMARVVEDVVHRTVFYDFTRIHNRNSVRHICNNAQVVRDENNGKITFFLQSVDKFKDLCLNGNVECRRRLVANQDVGICRQCDCDNDTLTHTARKFKGILSITDTGFGNTYLFHQLNRLFFCETRRDFINNLGRRFLQIVNQRNRSLVKIHVFHVGNVCLKFIDNARQDGNNRLDLHIQRNNGFRNNLPIHLFAALNKRVTLCRLLCKTLFFLRVVDNVEEIFIKLRFHRTTERISDVIFDNRQRIDSRANQLIQVLKVRISLFLCKVALREELNPFFKCRNRRLLRGNRSLHRVSDSRLCQLQEGRHIVRHQEIVSLLVGFFGGNRA